jgi:hypothetical protein
MMLYITSSHMGRPWLPFLKTGKQEVGDCNGRVQATGEGQHYSTFHLSMVQPASQEGGWQLGSVWRFPKTQPCDGT